MYSYTNCTGAIHTSITMTYTEQKHSHCTFIQFSIIFFNCFVHDHIIADPPIEKHIEKFKYQFAGVPKRILDLAYRLK